MKNYKQHMIFGALAIALMVMEMHGIGIAQEGAKAAGTNLAKTFKDTITGNIGLAIGLMLTLWGLWTWIVKQDTGAGVTMIAGGVAITLLPNIFDGMRGVVDGVVNQFGTSVTNGTGVRAGALN